MNGDQHPEVFTQTFKVKGSIISGCLTLFLFFGPLAGGVVGGALVGEKWGDGPGAIVGLTGLVLAFAGLIIGNQKVFLIGNSGLRRDLAAALERRLGRNPDDGATWFVGWRRGAVVDPVELDTDADVGFLALTPEKMTYTGDTVAFELYRQQVYQISLQQQGIPILWDLGKRVRIDWVDPYSRTNSFTFERREGSSKRDVRRKNQELTEILQQWHQFGSVPSHAPPPAVAP
jgi:hypothetical protein